MNPEIENVIEKLFFVNNELLLVDKMFLYIIFDAAIKQFNQ